MAVQRRRTLAALAALSAAALILPGTAYAGSSVGEVRGVPGGTAVPDSYVVVLKPTGATTTVIDSIVATHGGKVGAVWQHALQGFEVGASAAQAARIAGDPRVAYVQQNAVVSIAATQTPTPSWGLDRIDQRNRPLDNSYTYDTTAPNVTAYIIDTGIRVTHQDFGGRATWGTNTVGDGIDTDCHGHGTHVAGTTGGSAYGVAKGVQLVAVKVLGCSGGGTFDGVISGVNWVAQNAARPAVANMSLGGGAYQPLDDAVTGAVNSGVTFVVAAGNSNADACNFSPARTPSAITVNASDINDNRASFSNYGTCTDMFGPGVNIVAPWNTSDTATATLSGTSMASPHVAGGAALFLADNPTASPAAVTAALTSTATPNVIGNPGPGSPNLLLFTRAFSSGGPTKIFEQTDPSGRLRIAVFERLSPAALQHNTDFDVTVPAEFVVIGGGAEGTDVPSGNLLTASYPNASLTAWLVSTKDHLVANPVQVRAWAIGLQIAGLTPQQVRDNLTVSVATSELTAHPDVTATLPAGFTLVGGGFKVNWSGAGNLATASAPSGTTGWRARSKDHIESSPATTQAYAVGLRTSIAGVGQISSVVDGVTSGVAQHPASTSLLRAGYALSGCGAFVHWTGAGNLLWKIRPVAQGGQTGCAVASKDHEIADPASITAYAIGIRAD